jgi:hypothetical protein
MRNCSESQRPGYARDGGTPPEPFLWRKLAMLSFRALPNRNYRRQPKQRVASVSPALFFGQAGLAEEAGQARGAALRCVGKAVRIGTSDGERHVPVSWRHSEVIVEGPARIDTGGG